MLGKKKCPLRAQLPISASVVGRYDIVIGGDVGIDRLVTDLEDAPDKRTATLGPLAPYVVSETWARSSGLAFGRGSRKLRASTREERLTCIVWPTLP
jgi:hypothetical protein